MLIGAKVVMIVYTQRDTGACHFHAKEKCKKAKWRGGGERARVEIRDPRVQSSKSNATMTERVVVEVRARSRLLQP